MLISERHFVILFVGKFDSDTIYVENVYNIMQFLVSWKQIVDVN